jgi:hypothetical protein
MNCWRLRPVMRALLCLVIRRVKNETVVGDERAVCRYRCGPVRVVPKLLKIHSLIEKTS